MTTLHTSISKRRAQRGSIAPKRQAEINALPIPKRSKYRNIREEVDGIKFASKAEASRYRVLKLLQNGNAIRGLKLHTRYDFHVNGMKVGHYTDDFSYENWTPGGDGCWRPVVEDVKGAHVRDLSIRLKLMKALFGIDVQLVKR